MSTTSFSPPKFAGYTLVAGALVLMGMGFLLISDVPGVLLVVAAALVTGVWGLSVLIARPRLAITPQELTVRRLVSTTVLTPDDVERIRVNAWRRLALRNTVLELDMGERLVVLTRFDLGAHPHEAAAALSAAGWPVEGGR